MSKLVMTKIKNRKIYKYLNILLLYIKMENKNIAIYAKIDSLVKERATMYVTKCKLLKKDTDTMNKLIEMALDSYMIDKPL